jgi:hypothetical protein
VYGSDIRLDWNFHFFGVVGRCISVLLHMDALTISTTEGAKHQVWIDADTGIDYITKKTTVSFKLKIPSRTIFAFCLILLKRLQSN